MVTYLIIPAFIAGLLTFLAPCTLPLVPGYLGFISGVSLSDLNDVNKSRLVRRKVFLNGLFYVLGFSLVFVLMGSVAGWLGSAFLGQYRTLGAQVGGVFVVLFGLVMVNSAVMFYQARWPWLKYWRLPFSRWLMKEKQIRLGAAIRPGKPLSSLIFGSVFAIGWTPCVGPILGAILTLASTGGSVREGTVLLIVFSFGLAVPFLILAGGISFFVDKMDKVNAWLPLISMIGGGLIVVLGGLILTNRFGWWVGLFYRLFSFVNYEHLLNWL